MFVYDITIIASNFKTIIQYLCYLKKITLNVRFIVFFISTKMRFVVNFINNNCVYLNNFLLFLKSNIIFELLLNVFIVNNKQQIRFFF